MLVLDKFWTSESDSSCCLIAVLGQGLYAQPFMK